MRIAVGMQSHDSHCTSSAAPVGKELLVPKRFDTLPFGSGRLKASFARTGTLSNVIPHPGIGINPKYKPDTGASLQRLANAFRPVDPLCVARREEHHRTKTKHRQNISPTRRPSANP